MDVLEQESPAEEPSQRRTVQSLENRRLDDHNSHDHATNRNRGGASRNRQSDHQSQGNDHYDEGGVLRNIPTHSTFAHAQSAPRPAPRICNDEGCNLTWTVTA